MKIIVRVRELRKYHNLTQEQLAKELNISRQSLISLEQGRWLPSLPLALELAHFFHTPLEKVIATYPIGNDNQGKATPMPKDVSHWSPFHDFRDVREELDRFFNQTARASNPLATYPTINIRQDEEQITVEAHVPGYKEDDIDIDVTEEMVTITGKTNEEKEDADQGYLHREYRQESFSRSIGLPTPVVSDKATAKLANGILTISLLKITEQKPKTKRLKPTT